MAAPRAVLSRISALQSRRPRLSSISHKGSFMHSKAAGCRATRECRRLLRLEDAIELEPVPVSHEFKVRRVGVGRVVFGKQNVEVIKLGPVEPKRRSIGLWMFGGHDQLRNRR